MSVFQEWPLDGNGATLACAFVDFAERTRANNFMEVKINDLQMKLVWQVCTQL